MSGKSWPSGPNFTQAQFVGNNGGVPFEFTKWSEGSGYSPVSKLEVYYKEWMFTGIKVTLADGTQGMYGTTGQYYNMLELNPGELVTKATIWPDQQQVRVAQICLETNKNRKWYGAQHDQWWKEFPKKIDVGSGAFVGIGGGSSGFLDRVGLVFLLSKVKKITISDFKYTDPKWEHPEKLGGLTTQELSREPFANDGTKEILDWKFQSSTTEESTTTFTQASLTPYGTSADVEISGQILGISLKDSGGWEWSKTKEQTMSQSTTKQLTISWGPIAGQLKQNEGVECLAIAPKGGISLKYDALVTLTFADNNIPQGRYREKGTLGQTTWSQPDVTVRQLTLG